MWTLVLVFDLSSVLFTQDARKVGDYAFGTRVVDERPGRAGRELDLAERAEIAELEAEVKELTVEPPTTPGSDPAIVTAGSRKKPEQAWYTSVREEVIGKDILGRAADVYPPADLPPSSSSDAETSSASISESSSKGDSAESALAEPLAGDASKVQSPPTSPVYLTRPPPKKQR